MKRPGAVGVFSAVVRAAALVLLTCLLAPAILVAQTDTEPPKLNSLSIEPNPVDVTSGPQTVTVTMGVTDNLSGVSYGFVQLQSPSTGQIQVGYAYLDSGTPQDGNLVTNITIPQFSEAGDWTIAYLYLVDADTNTQYLYTPDLQLLGFQTTFTVISQQDTAPPQLTSFDFMPKTVNVSAADQSVTFTMGLSDDLSGLDFNCYIYCYWSVYLQSPSGKQYEGLADYGTSLLSGTPLMGVWQGTLTMPRYSEPGKWKVYFQSSKDAAGNFEYMYTADLQNNGFPNTLCVTSSPSDILTPQVSSLSFGPNFIDTTQGSQAVNVTIGLTDNLSGLQYAWIYFNSPSGQQTQSVFFSSYNRIAGTPLAGTYQYTFTMPQFSEAGTWHVQNVYGYDNVNNFMILSTDQVAAMGLPTELVVVLPSNEPDGSVGSDGGTVTDAVFGDHAQVTFPPGVLTGDTTVSIDVFTEKIQLPIPQGYADTATNFVNLHFDPEPALPLPAPGMTLVLPIPNQMLPGTPITLFKVDPVSGNLLPEPSVYGGNVVGAVNDDGLSATFTGIAGLSVVVGLTQSNAVAGDLDGDGKVDCTDMNIVKAAFGKRLGQAGFDTRADTNHDNVINVFDLAYVSKHLPAGMVCKFQDPKAQLPSINAKTVKQITKGTKK